MWSVSPSNQGANDDGTEASIRDLDSGSRMLFVRAEVVSAPSMPAHERDGSKMPVFAPELSPSDGLLSLSIGVILDDIECLCIHPPVELGVVNQSVSSLYEAECLLSILIDYSVYAIMDIFEFSGIEIFVDMLD